MKKIEEIGECPQCECTIYMFKTSNYKRYAKCESCGFSYSLPKAGKISNSALLCQKNKVPILIVKKKDQKAYFWSTEPCFNCIKSCKCIEIENLITEFNTLKVYEY